MECWEKITELFKPAIKSVVIQASILQLKTFHIARLNAAF